MESEVIFEVFEQPTQLELVEWIESLVRRAGFLGSPFGRRLRSAELLDDCSGSLASDWIITQRGDELGDLIWDRRINKSC